MLERLDPYGQRRDDWRIAKLSALVATLVGAKKPDGTAFSAADLLLEFTQPTKAQRRARLKPTQSVGEMEWSLIAWAKAHNVRVLRTAAAVSETPPDA